MHDTQNAGFCFKFFKIKSPQTGPMLPVSLGPSTFPLGHDKFEEAGVENFVGQALAQGFLNFLNPSPVSDLPSPNL